MCNSVEARLYNFLKNELSEISFCGSLQINESNEIVENNENLGSVYLIVVELNDSEKNHFLMKLKRRVE